MPHLRRRSWPATCHGLLALLLTLLCGLVPASRTAAEDLQHLRNNYREATQALAAGDRQRFQALRATLLSYPLLPYLDYADLNRRLERAAPGEITRFLDAHGSTPPGRRLRLQWLNHLAANQRWKNFLRHHDAALVSDDLKCHHALALYEAGDRGQGLSAGRALWQQGKSQPKACDPLFQRLREDGHIDDGLAWRRHLSALLNHNQALASYAARYFSQTQTRARAAFYADVEKNPRLLADRQRFAVGDEDEHLLIHHVIQHLAELDSRQALALWQHYRQSHSFSAEQAQAVDSALIRALHNSGHPVAGDDWLRARAAALPPDLLDWRLRELVRSQQWQVLSELATTLENHGTADSRWRYWHARALMLSGNREPDTQRRLLTAVSAERSFHGFLAAEWLAAPYQMQHQPLAISGDELAALANAPPVRRSRELFLLDELEWARREWTLHLTDQEQKTWVAAARLAHDWGWHHQAIVTLAQATYWNDIDLRFPLAHRQQFARQADATAVPVNLLLALARQESAFHTGAVSSAGARGLMQLMPATAMETARKHRIAYAGVGDLLEPGRNIQLGSWYYRQVLTRFNNNRILATAAYNAGPGRVVEWRRRSGATQPFDVWIEAIPFKETRNYVQNVLAFSIIYAHHLGLETTMLSDREKSEKL